MAEIIAVNDRTWRVEDGMVRFFLLCGDEKAALVDTGMNVPEARSIAEGLTDLPLMLINTHADRDHISGNGAFDEVWMSPDEEANYREGGGKGTIVPVRTGDVIDLGGRPLRIIDIPGHTPGSIAILDEKYRVLISGDTIQDGNIFMFGKYRNIENYIESLKNLAGWDGAYDEIYPMHGTFPVKPDLIGKLLEGAEQIVSGKAQGQAVDMWGTQVCLYKFPYAGFLCEMK
jgi:glyoxylase-like metal-dependent hydrolase (beta-lactamase superfamily II)